MNIAKQLQTCRICLTEGNNMKNLFTKNKPKLSHNLSEVAKIHIYPGDGLPSRICINCISKLNSCIEFIKLCQNSDAQLRTVLSRNKEHSSPEIIKCDYEDDDVLSKIVEESPDLSNNVSILTAAEKHIKLNDKEKSAKSSLEKKIEKQQCFTCGKVMSSRFRLKTHLRIHTGEKPYSCTHCNKTFSLAQNLKVHMRTHTGEKPLQCPVCGESFAQSAGLAAHKRKHTGQLPYRCVLCPRSFRTVGHLQYHIRRHTGEKNFECDTCGRAFITRSDLKQHLLTHTGVRPHVCCICGLRLTRSSHLKRHIQHIHNGLKPFSCTECPLTFTSKPDFDKHVKECVNRKLMEGKDT